MPGTLRSEQVRDGTLTKQQMAASAFYLLLTSINAAASPYAVIAVDELILVDSTAGIVAVNLPALAGIPDGRKIIVKDSAGQAGANNITVNPSGFELIDGGGAVVLSSAYAVVTLVKTAVQWVKI